MKLAVGAGSTAKSSRVSPAAAAAGAFVWSICDCVKP